MHITAAINRVTSSFQVSEAYSPLISFPLNNLQSLSALFSIMHCIRWSVFLGTAGTGIGSEIGTGIWKAMDLQMFIKICGEMLNTTAIIVTECSEVILKFQVQL